MPGRWTSPSAGKTPRVRDATPAARLRTALVAVRREAKRWAYVDRDPSLTATTLLVGSGRSGTTWVEEVIDRHHDHRVVFEPLRAPAAADGPLAGIPHGLYLRPGDPAPRWRPPIEAILRGRVRDRWADHQNHVLVAHRRLVKEIRANNLLAWLVDAFPELAVVWLVRHPCAVVTSATGLQWDDHVDALVGQADLVADHLEPLADVIGSASTRFDRLVVQWCIENLVPFRMLAPGDAHLVFYEELVERPYEVAAELLRSLGQEPDDALRAAVERPSKLATADSAVVRGADLVSGWRSQLSARDAARAIELVAAMGLGDVYGDDPRPDAAAGRALLARPWTPPAARTPA